MRARAEHMEQTRQTHASHVHSVQARESNRTRLLAKRLGEHRKAAEGKREDRLAAELTALPRVAAAFADSGVRRTPASSTCHVVDPFASMKLASPACHVKLPAGTSSRALSGRPREAVSENRSASAT